ncbi:MAG TPA: YigZ family protein [Aggregatilineales bacterium]|nr:YigZ family protein [Aggregatilineales bacterium]
MSAATQGYRVPASSVHVEHEVSRSRFIASLANVPTVQAARDAIASVRAEMPDASHHVYAFKVGYGASVVEGLSDDGEPTGTAGPPVMAVLRGAEIGDTLIVVTRYFGGIKLGTGGLVRAYSDAARAALAAMTTQEKIERRQLGLTVPYPLYERAKSLALEYGARVDDETFAGDITLYLTLPVREFEAFSSAIRDLSAGKITPVELS